MRFIRKNALCTIFALCWVYYILYESTISLAIFFALPILFFVLFLVAKHIIKKKSFKDLSWFLFKIFAFSIPIFVIFGLMVTLF